MQLFYTKRSPYARKVRILALEKGINLEYIDEDLTKKSRQLLKNNPLGKIPTLVLDDHSSLCDSPVICEYFDTLRPSPRFIPQDSGKRWAVLNTAAMADGMMDIMIGAYMEKVRHPQDFNKAFVEAQVAAIERLLGYFEGRVGDLKSWHLGSVGVVCSIGYLRLRLGEFYSPKKVPELDRWFQDVAQRPSVKDTVPVA